jgi:hypothetical protein
MSGQRSISPGPPPRHTEQSRQRLLFVEGTILPWQRAYWLGIRQSWSVCGLCTIQRMMIDRSADSTTLPTKGLDAIMDRFTQVCPGDTVRGRAPSVKPGRGK